MTDNNLETNPETNVEDILESEDLGDQEERRRKRLLWLLLLLLFLLCCAVSLFVRYLNEPAPLPDLLPGPVGDAVSYPPHYLFSIYGVESPLGIAISPDETIIYVAEADGQREVKMYDREGNLLNAISPPLVRTTERTPVYLATDPSGYLYVTDRMQNVVHVYDRNGTYLDTLIRSDLALSEFLFTDDSVTFLQGGTDIEKNTIAMNLRSATLFVADLLWVFLFREKLATFPRSGRTMPT